MTIRDRRRLAILPLLRDLDLLLLRESLGRFLAAVQGFGDLLQALPLRREQAQLSSLFTIPRLFVTFEFLFAHGPHLSAPRGNSERETAQPCPSFSNLARNAPSSNGLTI